MFEAVRAFGRIAFLAMVITAVGLFLSGVATRALAFEDIKDPKISAGRVAEVTATGQVDLLIDRLIAESREGFSRADLEEQFQVMNIIFDKARLPGSKDLLAEKIYGNSIALYWYRIVFRKKAEEEEFLLVYIKATYNKYIDYWQLTDFNFQTDLEKIGLPAP